MGAVTTATGGGVASGAGNVIAGPIIGLGVDAGTGANLNLRPNPMVARLVPVDSIEESAVLAEPQKKKTKKTSDGSEIVGEENDVAAGETDEGEALPASTEEDASVAPKATKEPAPLKMEQVASDRP